MIRLLKSSVLVLLSGGIDSSALIHYYKSLSFDTKALFIDYGQPTAKVERLSAKLITEYYDIELLTIELGFFIKTIGYEYSMRNALLINTALSANIDAFNVLAIGIHSGTDYYDSSLSFVIQYQEIIDGCFRGKIKLDTPFIDFKKSEVYEYAKSINLPIEKTYSCEVSETLPCNMCPSCKDRARY